MVFPMIALVAALMGGPQDQPEIVEDVTPYVVIYNIKDLEMVIPDYTNAPELDLNSVLNSRNGSSSPFRSQNNQNVPTQKNTQGIMDLIQSIVEPEAWGDTATMKYWNGNLIVKAPKRIHDQIK
jgi:hypothetical protein